MLRSILVLSILAAVCGCESHSQIYILPEAPLTEEQKKAIVRDDAETCNCGKDIESEISSSADGK